MFNKNTISDLTTVFAISLIFSTIALCILLLIAIYDRIERSETRKNFVNNILAIIAISLVGSVAGYAGGMSRTAAVGQIIPAALSLLGGLSIYLFGVQKIPSVILPITVAAFSMSLISGFSVGAKVREPIEILQTLRTSCIPLMLTQDITPEQQATATDQKYMKKCDVILEEMFGKVLIPI